MSKAGRKPGKRSVIYLYCSAEEKALLERAAARRVEHIHGARLPTYVYVLQAALACAREEAKKP